MGQQTLAEIIKECTTRMLKDAEQQTPMQAQIYSDMYREYVHMLENCLEVMYHSEKGSGIKADPGFQEALSGAAGRAADRWSEHLENCSGMLQWYARTRAQMAKTFDRYTHSMINAYIQAIEGRAPPGDAAWAWWGWPLVWHAQHKDVPQQAGGGA